MNSLERQLKYSLAGIFILILVGLFFIANASTRHILHEFVISRIEHDANNLLKALYINDGIAKVRWRQINPIYNTAFSGHYYSIHIDNKSADGITVSSPSLQGFTLFKAQNTNIKMPSVKYDVAGPQDQRIILWSNIYQIKGQKVVLSLAEETTSLKAQRKQFRWLFFIIGLSGIVLLLALQRLIIRRLFKRLDHARHEVKQIELGKKQQLSEDVPLEIHPLVKEFNHSLSLMQQRLERSRHSLGNLAHALKTPLSLLIQQLDNEDIVDDDKSKNKQAKLQAERIRQLMERELKRARLAGLGNTTQRFDPRQELPVLVDVLKQAHQQTALEIKLAISDQVTVFGDREDMLELLGNLLDNACKWAQSEVFCTITNTGNNEISLVVEDDGAGRSAQEIEQLMQRGVRLDESVDGHGLGLAICKDIVKLYGGSIDFDRSEKLGGFRVTIVIMFN